jgi:hypothetical protein
MTSIPQVTPTEVEPSNMSAQSPIDLIPSTSSPITSLHQPSPFSFSPCLHHILGRSRYIPTEDKDPKDEGVLKGCENYQSNLMVTPLDTLNSQTVNNSVHADTGTIGGNDHEGSCDDYDKNQAPSSLEYSDGEGGKSKGMVTSEVEDKEEVDELNLSEYEGLSIAGMLMNMDSGGYYKMDADNMDMADEVAPMDIDVGISEAVMDDGLPEETGPIGAETLEDEIPVKMEVNGEMCLFSWAVIAELHLLRENACLRGEEMDEESEEFSEEREYEDLISTVVVQATPVVGLSQLRKGQTGGNSYLSWS